MGLDHDALGLPPHARTLAYWRDTIAGPLALAAARRPPRAPAAAAVPAAGRARRRSTRPIRRGGSRSTRSATRWRDPAATLRALADWGSQPRRRLDHELARRPRRLGGPAGPHRHAAGRGRRAGGRRRAGRALRRDPGRLRPRGRRAGRGRPARAARPATRSRSPTSPGARLSADVDAARPVDGDRHRRARGDRCGRPAAAARRASTALNGDGRGELAVTLAGEPDAARGGCSARRPPRGSSSRASRPG